MPLFSDHAYTSITIKINQLADPKRNDEIDDSIELYLSDLIELIKVQSNSGAVEAARAIRKKIKYGDSRAEQLRALQILELLVLNGGPSIGPIIARDDKLLDVLKGIINGTARTGVGVEYDCKVQKRVVAMAIGWKTELDGLDGYKYMQSLYKAIPRRKRVSSSHSGHRDRDVHDNDSDENSEDVLDPYADDAQLDSHASNRNVSSPRTPRSPPPPRPSTKSPYASGKKNDDKDKKKNKKKKKKKRGLVYADEEFEIPQINYKVEAPKIRELIANCYTHTTALNNLLLQLPADESPLDNDKTLEEFAKCKKIRRKVLSYLQYVGAGSPEAKSSEVAALDEEFLGSLIGANEQLVESFKRFDFRAGYSKDNPAPNYDDESDSDESYYTSEESEEEPDDVEEQDENSISARLQNATLQSKSPPPPRPSKPSNLQSSFQPRPKLDKVETSESIEGNPFGDRNAVTKSVYD
ncbi:hypothetical protein MEQ_02335 [Candida albicans P87]|uniref:VHS domain-containing protein n=1 Tax=Candida albicans P78048 TaxID=1094989 RepID=A0AB34PVA6_CANAX|nr:hypothetical protein MG1_02382 [Candida albicans GC75]KGR13941.1 hypothetical protein MG3_02375 [Candida albicans P78048]KGR20778.1 hypothetical protein MG9_02370 [Candida albicans P37037]KGT70341.1 hypothetical protein MEK_02367 [Candida albicans 12C]KGU11255.1 hypothetical protein MEQ_02335 [Candida albicans P87]KGU33041.1 hypothetical protein MGM_02402 [Candida albicans P75063]KHC44673.1 hypothetical protein W5O_02363 [Candida albicans Ca6]KHC58065.1 hypothetical protein MGC_02355 [Can